MKKQKTKTTNPNISSHEYLEERKGKKPNSARRSKLTKIEDELAEDFGEILGEDFHGMDDDYYFSEDDIY